ncbi:hypothetical protein W911_04910 [Hyphomicrobium nitrativorans NL23]|jgi:hypothetical protein|uniref:Uncharacterized protein n=2 Tax=Hyphomicrobium TaxID=81 RepID=V5SJ54_9HYPH|nr:hypothetical protein [Hyphomicrobium sp.]AHB49979.1 hypothetical protein W911_04910 [Hyphomicrobium nitrativorans NL23]HRN89008.1 hypothetical protein [Hyphomicrobium sp.]HRQ27574.1 hypothetical protein [Hyphomicrobium sp.]
MMDVSRDIADFTRRAEVAYGAMCRAKGQIAKFCRDDARFYLERAIEIAKASGNKDMVAQLQLRRGQIMSAFHKQNDRSPSQQQHTGIERWENEGGSIGACPRHSHR